MIWPIKNSLRNVEGFQTFLDKDTLRFFFIYSKCASFAESNFLWYALLLDWRYLSQLITMARMAHIKVIIPWILLQYPTLVEVPTGETSFG